MLAQFNQAGFVPHGDAALFQSKSLLAVMSDDPPEDTDHAGAGEFSDELSPREVEVLEWTATGKSDWEIGQILRVSHKTVNYHMENCKRKLRVSTRIQAVVLSVRQGFITGTWVP